MDVSGRKMKGPSRIQPRLVIRNKRNSKEVKEAKKRECSELGKKSLRLASEITDKEEQRAIGMTAFDGFGSMYGGSGAPTLLGVGYDIDKYGRNRQKWDADMRAHDLGCAYIPFDEIKEKLDKGFRETGKLLSRNFEGIKNNARLMDRNLDAINIVGEKTDRNFRALENNLRAIERNSEAIDRNQGAILKNSIGIKENLNAIKQNTAEIKLVSAKVDRNTEGIERNLKLLKVNQGEIRLVGGKVDRNFGAIKQVSAQVDRNLDAVNENLRILKINEGEIKVVSGKVDRNYGATLQISVQNDRNFDAINENLRQLKINEGIIKVVEGKVDQNSGVLLQVLAQLDKNLEAINENSRQLKINEGEIRIIGGKVDRNFGALKNVTQLLEKNMEAIRLNLKGINDNYRAIKENNELITGISQTVDKNYATIVENYETTKQTLEAANRNLRAIEKLEEKMIYGFNYIINQIDRTNNDVSRKMEDIQNSLESSRLEQSTKQIIAFLEAFPRELEGAAKLSYNRLVENLENHTIRKLRSVIDPPRGLYNDLKAIIRQQIVIPKNADDKMSFVALELLYSGTELYTSILYSLVRSYTFLATHYYQRNDVEKYNHQLSELEITTRAFVDSLNGIGSNPGLLKEVDSVIKLVQERKFIIEEREDVMDTLSTRKNNLSLMRSNLAELIKLIPEEPLGYKINFDFSKSNVSTPIGDWSDGRRVSYAMHLEKSDGTFSRIGEWYSYQIRHSANPVLTFKPVSSGQKRSIFRKFDNDKAELVGVIEDIKQTEFRDINRDLYNAVQKLNGEIAMEEVDVLLKNGADPNTEFGSKGFLLHAAVRQGNQKIVRRIIEEGADMEARDGEGKAPLHLATENDHKSIVQMLLEAGADVNSESDLDTTPLHSVAHTGNVEIFNILVANGANVNSTTFEGFTPLHTAAASGKSEIVGLLASRENMDINSATLSGFTPLHLACKAGDESSVELLLRNDKINLNSRDPTGLTPLHVASVYGHLGVVRLLIDRSQKLKLQLNQQTLQKFSALHLAIFNSHESVALELLKIDGIDINSKTVQGLTPLHLAAMNDQLRVMEKLLTLKVSTEDFDNINQTPLHLAAREGNIQSVRALVTSGKAALNVRRKDGQTALQVAVTNDKKEVVEFLIGEGARINTRDVNQVSTLKHAIASQRPEILRIIVSAMKAKNYKLDGGLHSAASGGDLDTVKTMMDLKVEGVNSRDSLGITPIQLAAMSAKFDVVSHMLSESDLNLEDNFGNTIMHHAAVGGDVRVSELLYSQGATMNVTNNYNQTPFHHACLSANMNLVEYFMRLSETGTINKRDLSNNTAPHFLAASSRNDVRAKVIKFLDKNGVDLELANNEGRIPVLEFARRGNWAPVKYLVNRAGAKNIVETKEGQTVLHFAAKDGMIDLVELLTTNNPKMVDIQDNNGWPALFWAARFGHVELVKLLIEKKNAYYGKPAKDGSSILHLAVLSGKLDMVNYLVGEKKFNVNVVDNNSTSPLHLASENGSLDMVEFMLKNRAAMNVLDKTKSTPLMRAASSGNWKVVKLLINNGANMRIFDKNKNGLVHKCAEGGALDIIKSLNSSNFSSRNAQGKTPLHLAIENNHMSVIEYLVKVKGANLKITDVEGNTPLHSASLMGQLNVIKLLVDSGAEVDSSNNAGKNPCELSQNIETARYFIDQMEVGYDSNPVDAIETGNAGILKYLVEEQSVDPETTDNDGKSLLHHAAETGNIEAVRFLASNKKVDINKKDRNFRTAIHYALLRNNTAVADYLHDLDNNEVPDYQSMLFDLAKRKNSDMVEYVMRIMSDIGVKDSQSQTPLTRAISSRDDSGNSILHYAVTSGSLSLVKLLVGLGASSSVKNTADQTPLDLAENSSEIGKFLLDRADSLDLFKASQRGNLALLKNLIGRNKEVDIDIRDADGKTILDYAIENGHVEIIKYLTNELRMKPEGDLFSAIRADNVALVKYYVDGVKQSLTGSTKDGLEPISLAAALGRLMILKYLIEEKGLPADHKDTEGSSLLHHAASNNQLDVLKYLVEVKQVNVNNKNGLNQTPLHSAIREGHLSIVEYLVEKGADINAVADPYGTPLDYAITKKHQELVDYLSRKGAITSGGDIFSAIKDGNLAKVKYYVDVRRQSLNTNKDARDPVSMAAAFGQLNILKYFIEERGVEPHYKDHSGSSLLHYAAENNRLDVLKYLVEEKHVDVNIKNRVNQTPLHWAIWSGSLQLVKYLVEMNADLEARDNENLNSLEIAISNSRKDVLSYFIDELKLKYPGDLMGAAEVGSLVGLKYFLEVLSQDVNSRDALGWTPLHRATYFGHLKLVKYLIEKANAQVNVINSAKFSPLHAAAERNHLDIAKYLVEMGADVNSVADPYGTPLDYAITNKHQELVDYLKSKGAITSGGDIFSAIKGGQLAKVKYYVDVKKESLNTKNVDGLSPVSIAAAYGQLSILKYFIEEKGQPSDYREESGSTILHYAAFNNRLEVVRYLVEERQVAINLKAIDGRTMMHEAADSGSIEVIRYLVGRGADIESRDSHSSTPLDIAIMKSKTNVIDYFTNELGIKISDLFGAAETGNLNLIRYLIDVKSQDVRRTNEYGANILHVAAWKNRIEVVKYLVEDRKINLNQRDNRGRTALIEAASNLNLEMVKYLIEKGARYDMKAKDGKTTALKAAVESKNGKSPVSDYLCSFYTTCSINCFNTGSSPGCLISTTSNHRPVRSASNQMLESNSPITSYQPSGNEETRGPGSSANQTLNLQPEASDLGGTLLLLFSILNRIPIIGKLFSKVGFEQMKVVESNPMPASESMVYGREISVEFGKLLRKTASHLGIPLDNLNYDPFKLASDVSRLLRSSHVAGGDFAALLSSYAETASQGKVEFLELLEFELEKVDLTSILMNKWTSGHVDGFSIRNQSQIHAGKHVATLEAQAKNLSRVIVDSNHIDNIMRL